MSDQPLLSVVEPNQPPAQPHVAAVGPFSAAAEPSLVWPRPDGLAAPALSPPFFEADAAAHHLLAREGRRTQQALTDVELGIKQAAVTARVGADELLDASTLLHGLLFPEERLLEVPLLVASRIDCQLWPCPLHNGALRLTSHRLLLLRSEGGAGTHIEPVETGSCHCLTTGAWTLSHDLFEGNYFYPIDLANVHGLRLETLWQSGARQTLVRRRLLLWLVLLSLAAVISLVGWIFFGVNQSEGTTAGWELPIAIIFLLLFAAALPLWFCCQQHKPRGRFPYASHQKTLTLGVLDPLTQTNTIITVTLPPAYPLAAAKRFVEVMQGVVWERRVSRVQLHQ